MIEAIFMTGENNPGSSVPFWLIFSQTLGWVRILRQAAAMSLELVGSTSRPECRVCMMSTGPPFLVATVGTPCAAACKQQSMWLWTEKVAVDRKSEE